MTGEQIRFFDIYKSVDNSMQVLHVRYASIWMYGIYSPSHRRFCYMGRGVHWWDEQWRPGFGSTIYYVIIAAVRVGALHAIKQMNTSYMENALACPRCGKKNVLKLQILHKDSDWGEVPRKTYYHSRGSAKHYSTWH